MNIKQQYTQKDKITNELIVSSLLLAKILNIRHLPVGECIREHYDKLLSLGTLYERQEHMSGQVKTFYTLGLNTTLKLLELLKINKRSKKYKTLIQQITQEFKEFTPKTPKVIVNTAIQQLNNNPISFMFGNTHEVRTLSNQDGSIWFVANDIARALEYVNTKDALKRHIDDEDRAYVTIYDVTNAKGVTIRDTLCKNTQTMNVINKNRKGVVNHYPLGKNPQTMNVINESGMFSLILSSKKKEAKAFKRWITTEVLPQIRKTGSYHNQTQLNNQPYAMVQQHIASVPLVHHQDGVYIYSGQLTVLLGQSHQDIINQIKTLKQNQGLTKGVKHLLSIKKYKEGYLLNIYALFCLNLKHDDANNIIKLHILDSFIHLEKRIVLTINNKLKGIQDKLLFEGFNKINPMIADLIKRNNPINLNFIKTQLQEIKPLLENIKQTIPKNKVNSSGINIVIHTLNILENNQENNQLEQQLQYLINQLNILSSELRSKGDDITQVIDLMKQIGKFVDFSDLEHTIPISNKTLSVINN